MTEANSGKLKFKTSVTLPDVINVLKLTKNVNVNHDRAKDNRIVFNVNTKNFFKINFINLIYSLKSNQLLHNAIGMTQIITNLSQIFKNI